MLESLLNLFENGHESQLELFQAHEVAARPIEESASHQVILLADLIAVGFEEVEELRVVDELELGEFGVEVQGFALGLDIERVVVALLLDFVNDDLLESGGNLLVVGRDGRDDSAPEGEVVEVVLVLVPVEEIINEPEDSLLFGYVAEILGELVGFVQRVAGVKFFQELVVVLHEVLAGFGVLLLLLLLLFLFVPRLILALEIDIFEENIGDELREVEEVFVELSV